MADRRQFITGIAAVSTVGITGCSDAEEEPDPLVSEARNAEPRNVSTSQDGNEFTAEIRNSGLGSTILVDLHWEEDEETSPSPAASTNTFIGNNETREVTLTAEPPAWATGYRFFYQGTTYAADVLNQGGQSDLDVWIEDLATGEVIQEQRITLTEEEERTVEFETEHEFEGGFEITAETVS